MLLLYASRADEKLAVMMGAERQAVRSKEQMMAAEQAGELGWQSQYLSGDLSERIKTMMSSGLEPAVIARAVGCEASYITQLMEDAGFREEVQAARIVNLTDATERDKRLTKLEDLAINRLEATIPMVMKPMEAAKILQIVNNTKRRGAELQGGNTSAGAPVVTVMLPEAARVSFTFNSSNQVVDVEGRSMAPLPNNRLMQMAAERRATIAAQPAQLTDQRKAATILDKIGVADLQAAPAVVDVLGQAGGAAA